MRTRKADTHARIPAEELRRRALEASAAGAIYHAAALMWDKVIPSAYEDADNGEPTIFTVAYASIYARAIREASEKTTDEHAVAYGQSVLDFYSSIDMRRVSR